MVAQSTQPKFERMHSHIIRAMRRVVTNGDTMSDLVPILQLECPAPCGLQIHDIVHVKETASRKSDFLVARRLRSWVSRISLCSQEGG